MNMTRSLQRSINTMINQAVDNAPYDKTRTGVVLARSDDDTYTIKIDGVIYNKIPIMSGFKASVNDIVKVVIPTNNSSQMFISTVGCTTEITLIGEIKMYAGNREPKGWLLCDGRELLISDYPELYNAIGDIYGTASDTNHFVLPDLRSRFPIGIDTLYPLGGVGGSAHIQAHTHEFTQPKIPNHSHAPNNETTPKAFMTMVGSGSTGGLGEQKITAGSSSYVVPRANDGTDFQRIGSTATDGGGGATTGGEVGVVSGLPSSQTTGNSGNIPPYIGLNFLIYCGNIL